jgi:hypothetical protein
MGFRLCLDVSTGERGCGSMGACKPEFRHGELSLVHGKWCSSNELHRAMGLFGNSDLEWDPWDLHGCLRT